MPTKSELEGRASRIVQVFQKVMPPLPIPYPAIIICTQRTYRDQRGFLVYKTGSTAIAAPAEESAIEVIMGAKGTALLVRKEQITSLDSFYHLLWVALGRFYIGATSPSVVAAMQSVDEGNAPEDDAVVGTAFWSFFAPEAIANRVEHFLRTAAGDRKKEITWNEEAWRLVYDEMKLGLLSIYGQRNIQIPELAFYLASTLTDYLVLDLIRKAREGALPGKERQSFDPVGVDTMPVEMREPMERLITVLEGQVQLEQYWEADEETLGRIGELLTSLNEIYVALIADELIRDELDAAPIPKVLPEDLFEDLPEID